MNVVASEPSDLYPIGCLNWHSDDVPFGTAFDSLLTTTSNCGNVQWFYSFTVHLYMSDVVLLPPLLLLLLSIHTAVISADTFLWRLSLDSLVRLSVWVHSMLVAAVCLRDREREPVFLLSAERFNLLAYIVCLFPILVQATDTERCLLECMFIQ